LNGLNISPWFSGGEVRQTIDHGTYRTLVHRPVFDGLIGERSNGFVQIDWVPKEKFHLPVILQEEFDADGDGKIDFSVRLQGENAELLSRASQVTGSDPLVSAGPEKILRVRLKR
jgi:hypothetical protein